MLKFSAACVLLLASLPAAAQSPRVSVDPRIELMSIIFRLAGNSEYNEGEIPAYNAAIDRWFAPFKDHEAVRLAHHLRQTDGVAYDAPMSLAISVKDVATLAERTPLDAPDSALDARWHGAKARAFLAAARKFVTDTDFAKFLDSQSEFYEKSAAALRAVVEKEADFGWFEKFFGTQPAPRFFVVLGLVSGGGSYGRSTRAEDGGQESYAVLGVWQVDAAGQPVFNKNMIPTIVHEMVHSWANPLLQPVEPQIRDAGDRMYKATKAAMQRQAYGSGTNVLNESLVRVCTARYILAHDGPDAARANITNQRSRSFLWTQELFDLLGEYEHDRAKYPTLQSFMPRVAAYFKDLGPRVGDMVKAWEAARPRVVSINPPNGTTDVDPALKQIVVRFDRPMTRKTYSVMMTAPGLFPKADRAAFDDTGTIFTLDVQLEPNRDYEFSLNSESGGTFASADGVSLAPVRIHFRTRH